MEPFRPPPAARSLDRGGLSCSDSGLGSVLSFSDRWLGRGALWLLAATLAWVTACAPEQGQRGAEHPTEEAADLATVQTVQVPVEDSPTLGPADALVTIVEFVDYECPFCARVHPTIAELMRRYPGEVRWVVKHNPLGFHPRALPAALLAVEVRAQKGEAAFWEANTLLLSAPRLDRALFQALLDRYELDPESLRRSWALGADHPALVSDVDLATDLEVHGTPHFFINGRRVEGAQPFETFDAIVAEELARARALTERGVPRAQVYATLQEAASPPPGLTRVVPPLVGASVPSLGPENAEVTVQVFSDFECPFCRQVMPTLDELQRRYAGKIRVVWRHYPLPFHRHARRAARAAEEAYEQKGNDGFWRMARRMLGSEEQRPEPLNPPTLVRYAEELGLELTQFQHAIASEEHQERIESDIAAAREVGVEGTPGFLINGYQLFGAQPLRRFERLVQLSLNESGSTPGESR